MFQSPKGRLQTGDAKKIEFSLDGFNPQREGYKRRGLLIPSLVIDGFNPQRGGYKHFMDAVIGENEERFNPQRGGYKQSL